VTSRLSGFGDRVETSALGGDLVKQPTRLVLGDLQFPREPTPADRPPLTFTSRHQQRSPVHQVPGDAW